MTKRMVKVNCGRWECSHCGKWQSAVLARAILMDAAIDPPTFSVTLTTNDPSTSRETYVHGSAMVWKRLRRHFGAIDYLGFMEWTTGLAVRSGGHRRMHGHYLVKPRDLDRWDAEHAERLVRETWQEITGAYIVEVAELRTPNGAIQYLGLHHRKAHQRPPDGWRGMRLRPSRGYWHRPVWEVRRDAANELILESRAHRAGITPLELLARDLEHDQEDDHANV